jgi:hypothetical protein
LKLTKNNLAATLAALSIGSLVINPVSAAVNETGRVDTSTRAGVELQSDMAYDNGRSAPEGTQPIMESKSDGKTNGRTG